MAYRPHFQKPSSWHLKLWLFWIKLALILRAHYNEWGERSQLIRVKLQSSFCGVSSFLIKVENCEWEREILRENWWEVNWEKGWKREKLGREDHESGALQGKKGKALQQDKGKMRKLENGERKRKREMADAKKDALTRECDITKVVQVWGWWERMTVHRRWWNPDWPFHGSLWGVQLWMLSWVELCPSLPNFKVKVLTSRTSECDLTWR